MMDSIAPPADHRGFRSPREYLLSGDVTLPQIFEWNARENPDHPLFRFHDESHITDITYRQAIQGIRRAARYVNACIGSRPGGSIAVIANADTVTYSLTSLGIIRAGHTPFLISTRNASAAVVDMLRKTNCRHVLASQDAPIQSLIQAVSDELDDLMLHRMPVFEDFDLDHILPECGQTDDLPKQYDLDSMAIILHSSGSTNHPKPIRWTHKRLTFSATCPWFGEVNLTSAVLGIHGTPMFHGMGVLMYCFAVTSGMVLACFPPSLPPRFPSPENVFDGLVKTSSEYVMTAPAFIELWSRDTAKVDYMKRMTALIFGGAPLSQDVGDALVSSGVSLYSMYGSTEVGPVPKFLPAKTGMDWAYFELSPMNHTVTLEVGQGRCELIVMSDPRYPLPITNTSVNGIDGYSTNDILEPHPTKSWLWRYYGRLDDQILLSNGEKTNPGPIEEIINEDPHVRACVMFGSRKLQNGVLIEPTPQYSLDPENVADLEDFRNSVWRSIGRANEIAPHHSRLFKEMIMVASPSKPFTYNIKGYPRRQSILKEYHDEIEQLYATVDKSAQSDVVAPVVWDTQRTRDFVRTIVENVVKRSVPDDADLFHNGCDSLQATWIRNTILRVVREGSPAAAQKVNMNIVFQAPSITALTNTVLRIMCDSSGIPIQPTSTVRDLLRIAEQHSSNLPARPSYLRTRDNTQHVVLITGTTGGFGCDLLEHLLRDGTICKVYAFNRPGAHTLVRQHLQFRKRGLEEDLLSSPKFQMVEAVLDDPGFGLEDDLLEEIRSTLTLIIHNAWTVNFNLALSSFEADLKAVRNLIDLSLSSPFSEPPKIQLVSSVAVCHNCTIPAPVPEVPLDPSSALGTGYGESKWIAERVLQDVTERTGIPVVIVRLGQVSGDKTGHWNEREWFPALVKSALIVRCLPDVEGRVSFVSGYPAARACAEMRESPARILHLVHPRPVSWHDLIAPIADELGVALVPYTTWLAALESNDTSLDCASDVETIRVNPALGLLDFFRSQSGNKLGKESLGSVLLSTDGARSVSETLASMPALGEMDARRWVAAWRASGFLSLP